MKAPGRDGRHRDKVAPKAGEIQQKRSDSLNKHLPTPIPVLAKRNVGDDEKSNGKDQRGSRQTSCEEAEPDN